jgi:hypothetical protein
VAFGFRADKDQLARMLGVTRGVCESDHAAEGSTVDDGLHNPEHVAERFYIVAPLGKVPSSRVIASATTVSAMVEVDDLGDVGQSREGWITPSIMS